MTELFEIMCFIGYCMGSVFYMLDSAYIGEYSYLDIIIALMFFRLVLWFIFRVLGFNLEDQYRMDVKK
jgi:hypothetical protein